MEVTSTQKTFNEISSKINEVKNREVFGHIAEMLKNIELRNLQNKLYEVAMELQAERYATQY